MSTWCDDGLGIVVQVDEIKCFKNNSSWRRKLSLEPGYIRVATYSLDVRLACYLFRECQGRVSILCNALYEPDARRLKTALPQIEIACRKSMHAKLILIEPDTVYLGSMNLVRSDVMHDVMMGVRGLEIHNFYANWFDTRWQRSTPISGPHTANAFLEFGHARALYKQSGRFKRHQLRRIR